MKRILRKIAFALAPIIDILLVFTAIPAGLVLAFYRRLGSRQLPVTTTALKRIGVFPICNHYYEPMFNDRHLTKPLNEPRALPGVDFNLEGQLDLLDRLAYADEFQRYVEEEKRHTSDTAFRIDDKNFNSGDADFLFQFIRYFKPEKVVEIGSGSSTKIASKALALNAADSGNSPQLVCIEPYEMPWLEQMSSIELIRSRIEDCRIDWNSYLQEGDLLFIDSSHMIRPQGDVLHEYLEIIPQLRSGVFVHVHDIFSPRDYLDVWVRRDVRFWNEQYLLESMLSNTSRYEVVAALNQLKHEHYESLQRVCPFLDQSREPGSFYFRVR